MFVLLLLHVQVVALPRGVRVVVPLGVQVAHDDVVLQEDEEKGDWCHVGLGKVRDGHEAGEGDSGSDRVLPLQAALHELAQGYELHHDGLDAHHVAQEHLKKNEKNKI